MADNLPASPAWPSNVLSDSSSSRDTLPTATVGSAGPTNFSTDQLKAYIKRMLGGSVWSLEITDQDILDCIQDALSLFSQWAPVQKYWAMQMLRSVHTYLTDVDCGQGVIDVHFVQPVPTPTAIFYGNLIDPTPIFRVGVDEYDTFLRWRKTWMRVTSVQPDWLWDSNRRVLFIHNPIERYYASIFTYHSHANTQTLPLYGAIWVKKYALERSRLVYGEILAKFSGAIPGPVKDLQLDTQKRDKAEAKIRELEDELFRMQTFTPLSGDSGGG